MAKEIERKFLVIGKPWEFLAQCALMRQGYLLSGPDKIVRVRLEADNAWLTIKGKQQNLSRQEWEFSIPADEAEELLALCEQPLIEKYRYRIPFDDMLWELDVFVGANLGLVVAEIELESEGQRFNKPDWVGTEVTHDSRYLNSNLIHTPFSAWDH